MARQTKEEKRIGAEVDAAFRLHANNVQIPIFDVGKVLDAGRDAGRKGENVSDAVKIAVEKYRAN